jgi:hypothetical protein
MNNFPTEVSLEQGIEANNLVSAVYGAWFRLTFSGSPLHALCGKPPGR